MSNIYSYESKTKEIYDYDAMYELLKQNENRRVKIHFDKTMSSGYKEERGMLQVDQDENNVYINSHAISKDNIYDVYSDTYFGNWLTMNINNDEQYVKFSVIVDEQKVIDGRNCNMSFVPNDYWKEICTISNKNEPTQFYL